MGSPRLDRLDKNLLINGGMDYFQRQAASVAVSISTTSTYSGPDRWKVHYTGTVTGAVQILRAASNANNSLTSKATQFALRRNGTTATLVMEQRIESIHCGDLAHAGSGSFSVRVFVPIASVQARLTVNTANVLDNFSAVTQIHQSTSTQVIAASTWTTVDFENIAFPANSTNGVSIIIELLIPTGTDGAALNYLMTQAMLTSGIYSKDYAPMSRSIAEELNLCRRYYSKTYEVDTPILTALTFSSAASYFLHSTLGGPDQAVSWDFPVIMRALPVASIFNPQNGTPGAAYTNGTLIASSVSDVSTRRVTAKVPNSQVDDTLLMAHFVLDAEL